MARRRSLDHSARFDRAHRNHPRQQRRGALWRQRDRRRHQHRHRRPASAARRSRSAAKPVSAPFNQRLGRDLGRDQFRAVVDVILRQRHQVRRLPGQQRARPAQRRRQSQLHHAGPQGLPDRDRRRPEAAACPAAAWSIRSIGLNELVTNRRGTSTPFDYGNQQGASVTAGFTKTIDERRRPHRRWRRARQEAAGRLLRHRCRRMPLQPMSTAICRHGRSRRA